MISPTAKIYPNVHLGEKVEIGDYAVIGVPPKGKAEGQLETVIGDGAVIRSHSVIYAGNQIGKGFQTGHHAMIREENRIGDNVSVGTNSVVEHHVEIGNGVRIHSQAFVPEYSVLEEGAWIGPNVVLTNVPHPLCSKAKECIKGPTIKRGAKIGANSTILPFVIVGENALVGAGSVVVHNVPPQAVVAGNPAKVVKSVDQLRCPVELMDKPYGGEG
jgi:acetyltransferase-like isoleucine patch superfamily enzyme